MPLGRAGAGHTDLEDLGFGVEAHLGLEATEAPAVDADPLRVDVARRDQVPYAVDEVLDLRAADLLEVRLLEQRAVARHPARVDRARHVAVHLGHVAGEHVGVGLVAPLDHVLAGAERAAVDVDQERAQLAVLALGLEQQAVDLLPVAVRVGEQLGRACGQLAGLRGVGVGQDLGGPVRLRVDELAGPGLERRELRQQVARVRDGRAVVDAGSRAQARHLAGRDVDAVDVQRSRMLARRGHEHRLAVVREAERVDLVGARRQLPL